MRSRAPAPSMFSFSTFVAVSCEECSAAVKVLDIEKSFGMVVKILVVASRAVSISQRYEAPRGRLRSDCSC